MVILVFMGKKFASVKNFTSPLPQSCYFFYIRAAGRRARSARRPAVQHVSVIAQGHGGGHASPIEAAGQ